MTAERLQEIRKTAERYRGKGYPAEIDELLAALEAERARLDWILSHPREFREMIWDSEDESDPALRDRIDSARASEKGAGR